MTTLTIDGRQVASPDGSTVIQAAERLGVFIPRYCYHPGLSIAGNCRICLVEVEKSPKLQIACNTPVTEGMVVHTKSAKAEDGRRAVLEFLLANHPLDCPVCDQSGECDLQDFYMNFGLYDPRFREQKVKKKKAVAIGPHVMLDQERCILCSRCVRFADEITKTGEFGIFNRGDKAELGLYPGLQLDNPYSGNVVDICPVGALTERDFRFKARVWYLSSAKTVCNGCSQGCNVELHYALGRPHLNQGARVLRLKPRHNPDVNQWWMCDEGRYGFGWIDQGRLTKVRHHGVESTWDEAIPAIAEALPNCPRLAVIASAQLTNEELFLLREIFQGALVTASVPSPPGSSDDFLIKADKNPNTMGATLLGLAGPSAPAAASIVAEALQGRIDGLWVFGHDLAQLFGEETLQELSRKLRLFV
ncbi:MAG: 2Fe-2S iron-sulfur cluster-binding protein, partial [Terriglobia bacterium]